MRKNYSTQIQLDSIAISDVQLKLNCRDEIIPILRGLQDVYKQPELRDEILLLIASDVNAESRDDVGRDTSSQLQRLRRQSGSRAVVRWEVVLNHRIQMVPGGLGLPNELEGSGGEFSRQLGSHL